MGTALNKILKDMITPFHQMNGKDSVYVQVRMSRAPNRMEDRRTVKKEKNKDEVPIKDFRQECRVCKKLDRVHIKEFKRLGVVGILKIITLQ